MEKIIEFLEKYYKSKDYVYPSVIHRNTKEPMDHIYHICDHRPDLKKIYMIQCPVCQKMFYPVCAISDIPDEIGCFSCDHEVKINFDNIIVIFQKI